MKQVTFVLALTVACGAAHAVTATLSPLSTFGGGDGWLAPGEAPYMATAHNERGFAYNPVTGNLILVSRTTGLHLKILNGATGADAGSLAQGTGIITGGTFAASMAGVADDGAIYIANLSTAATTNFRVYRWGSETAAAPTVAFSGLTGRARTGDSFDVVGSGAGTRIVASGGMAEGGYALLSTTDGLSYSAAQQATGPTGSYRLGITFALPGQVWGKQTGAPLQRSLISPLTNLGTSPLTTTGEAPMDFAFVYGTPILATIDISNSMVRVYSMLNPAAPALLASLRNTSGTLTSNVNGVGQVRFGAISGGDATLYAMSTNQGLQAFRLNVVPEPGTMIALAAGLGALVARRRARKS